MGNILKTILWLAILAIVAFLVFGGAKKEVVAPTPEMTGGAGGERVEMEDTPSSQIGEMSVDVSTESSVEIETSSPVSPLGE